MCVRKFIFKKRFHKEDDKYDLDTTAEQDAVNALQELLEENDETSKDADKVLECIWKKIPKFQPLSLCPAVHLFVRIVTKEFENLSPHITHDN